MWVDTTNPSRVPPEGQPSGAANERAEQQDEPGVAPGAFTKGRGERLHDGHSVPAGKPAYQRSDIRIRRDMRVRRRGLHPLKVGSSSRKPSPPTANIERVRAFQLHVRHASQPTHNHLTLLEGFVVVT